MLPELLVANGSTEPVVNRRVRAKALQLAPNHMTI